MHTKLDISLRSLLYVMFIIVFCFRTFNMFLAYVFNLYFAALRQGLPLPFQERRPPCFICQCFCLKMDTFMEYITNLYNIQEDIYLGVLFTQSWVSSVQLYKRFNPLPVAALTFLQNAYDQFLTTHL